MISTLVIAIILVGAYRYIFYKYAVVEPQENVQRKRNVKGQFVEQTQWIEDKCITNRFSYGSTN